MRVQILSLIAWQSDARDEFEVKDAPEAHRLRRRRATRVVLEFEFISRKIAAKQSMR
jgi:hypothetical protein